MAEEDIAPSPSLTAVQQMISSCSGAILTSTFVTPLDVVKIRLQAQQKPQNFQKGGCFLYCNGLMDHLCPCLNGNSNNSNAASYQQWYRRPAHFNGTLDAFRQIIRNEGITSLWSGLPPTLVMAVPATVVYFTCYEQIKAYLSHSYEAGFQDQWWKPVMAGATARVFAVSVISPLELVRTKLQSEQLTYSQINVAVQKTIRNDGVRSLWRGFWPTIFRDVPFSALYWIGYEYMKTSVIQERGSAKLTFAESFIAGALSGTIAGVLTLPFDVIKTHRQIELGRLMTQGTKEVTSTWALIQQLYRSKGPGALFAGIVPRVIKVAPACAIMISTYEFFKSFFQQRNSSLTIAR